MLMSSSSASLPTLEGPGPVSRAPNFPARFTDTFVSRYVDTGDLRLHAVAGGARSMRPSPRTSGARPRR
jgi:hypothetical protein